MQHRKEVREKNCCSENYLSIGLSHSDCGVFIPPGLSFFSTDTVQLQTATLAGFVISILIKSIASWGCFLSYSSFPSLLTPTHLANLQKDIYATKITFAVNDIGRWPTDIHKPSSTGSNQWCYRDY
jgi:hypothetical protein